VLSSHVSSWPVPCESFASCEVQHKILLICPAPYNNGQALTTSCVIRSVRSTSSAYTTSTDKSFATIDVNAAQEIVCCQCLSVIWTLGLPFSILTSVYSLSLTITAFTVSNIPFSHTDALITVHEATMKVGFPHPWCSTAHQNSHDDFGGPYTN
jgi:hypothetical protein